MLFNTEIAGAGQRAGDGFAWPKILGWKKLECVLVLEVDLASGVIEHTGEHEEEESTASGSASQA